MCFSNFLYGAKAPTPKINNMSLQHTKGLLIGSLEIGEADRIVVLYTEDFGKIRLAARGCRRMKSRLMGSTQLLTLVDVVFFKKNQGLHRLTQSDIIYSFPRLRGELRRMMAGLYVIELLNAVTPEAEPNRPVFGLTNQILNLMNEGGDLDTLLLLYEIRLMSLAGYQPQVNHCVKCHRPLLESQQIRFIVALGGIACESCCHSHIQGIKLSLGNLNFLRQALKISLDKLGRLSLTQSSKKELQSLLRSYLAYYLERELHSTRFLEL